MISMILEFCNGGSLQERIVSTMKKQEHFSNQLVGKWTAQITSAVAYIHQQRILHRDLKSENVFLLKFGLVLCTHTVINYSLRFNFCIWKNYTNFYHHRDDTIKLGDFGISKDLNHTLDKASTCVGTPCYLSPELCQDVPYSFKSDVWALGCLVYEVVMLKPAFDAANLISLFHKIVNCKFEPVHQNCPLKNFISSILVADSALRPSASQLLKSECLSPYLVHIGQSENSEEIATSVTSQGFCEDDWSKLDDMLRTGTDQGDLFATSETILAPNYDDVESDLSSCCSSMLVFVVFICLKNSYIS